MPTENTRDIYVLAVFMHQAAPGNFTYSSRSVTVTANMNDTTNDLVGQALEHLRGRSPVLPDAAVISVTVLPNSLDEL